MAATPRYKVYTADGRYMAACKEPEGAACLMTLYGEGATVRLNHKRVLWTEGKEKQEAGNSYDFASLTMQRREHGTQLDPEMERYANG